MTPEEEAYEKIKDIIETLPLPLARLGENGPGPLHQTYIDLVDNTIGAARECKPLTLMNTLGQIGQHRASLDDVLEAMVEAEMLNKEGRSEVLAKWQALEDTINNAVIVELISSCQCRF